MLWNAFCWKFFGNRHKWSCLEAHGDKRNQDTLTTLLAQFSVPWTICWRIMVERRLCVPSLLVSGSKEKTVELLIWNKTSIQQKALERISTHMCLVNYWNFISVKIWGQMLHWLKLVAKTSPGSSGTNVNLYHNYTNVIYTIKSLFCWLFSTSDCTWQA